MPKFSVYYNPEEISELCDKSPYNLKKDIKNIDKEELDKIAEEIEHEENDEAEKGIQQQLERELHRRGDDLEQEYNDRNYGGGHEYA